MPTPRTIRILAAAILLVSAPALTAAERPTRGSIGSAYVPLDSWIYPALDRLAALGYLPSYIAGQRPLTRMECARLVAEAADGVTAGRGADDETEALVSALESELHPELAGQRRQMALESVYTRLTGITGTPMTDGYHFNQSIVNDFGRPYGEGANVSAEPPPAPIGDQ